MAPEKKQHVKLGDIADVQTGPFGSQLHASDYKTLGTPIITVEHLGDNEILHQNLPLVGAADRQRLTKYSLKEGDIVFTRVGAIDRRAYVSKKEDGWLFSGRLLRVRATGDAAHGRFLSHLFGEQGTIQWIRNHAVGSTMACLNTSILSAVPLNLPPIPEQRRIAEVLDTLDEALKKTEQVIVKLKQVKQGLLHDLLTRGIDENGELRDPERHPEQFKKSPLGRIPKAWDVERLRELAVSGCPITYGVVQPGPHDSNGVLFVRGGDFPNGRIEIERLRTISRQVDLQYARTKLCGGEILVSLVGQPGSSAVVPLSLAGANIARQVAVIRLGSRVHPEFLHAYISSARGQQDLMSDTLGTVQRVVNLKDLRELCIPVPAVKEQGLIVSGLKNWHSRYDAECNKLSKLRLLKQGLMKDLLTGQVPVTPLLAESPP